MKKKILVIGNGPETKLLDFNNLPSDYATIGMNSAYRDWYRIDFRPDYYISMDETVTLSHADEILNLINEGRISQFLLEVSILKKYPELSESPNINLWTYKKNKPEYISDHVWKKICELKQDTFFSATHITTGAAAIRYGLFLGYEELEYIGLEASYTGFLPEHVKEADGVLRITKTPEVNPNYYFNDYQQEGDLFLEPNQDYREVCHCENCKGEIFDSRNLHRLALEFTINRYKGKVSRYFKQHIIEKPENEISISLYILNFNNINHSIEQANKMEEVGITTKIVSASREKQELAFDKGKIIYVSEDYFYGSMAEIAIEDSSTDVTGLMACDVTVVQADVIYKNMQWAFSDNAIGGYAPNVDYTYWKYNKSKLELYGRECFIVPHTDSSLWFTRTEILKSMMPTDMPRPFFGWGIELVTSQIMLSHGLKVLRDYSVTVGHPKSTSYNKLEAEEQQRNLYDKFGGCLTVEMKARSLLEYRPRNPLQCSQLVLEPRMAIISCNSPYDSRARRNRNIQIFLSKLHDQGLSEYVYFVNANVVKGLPKPVSLRRTEACTFIDVEITEDMQFLWQKENLLNIALEKLPERYNQVAWLDAGVMFDDADWYQKTVDKLKSYDLVQAWSSCFWYGKYGEIFKQSKSVLSDDMVFEGRGHNHPGLALAARINVIKRFKGLYAKDPTGANEAVMMAAFLGKKELVASILYEDTSPSLFNSAKSWGAKLKIGFVENTIHHLYHDQISNDKHISRPFKKGSFSERLDLLYKHGFDLNKDVKLNKSGLFEWNRTEESLKEDLKKYLMTRYEDEY